MRWPWSWLTCPVHPQRWRWPVCVSCVALAERVVPLTKKKPRSVEKRRAKLHGEKRG